MIASKKYWLLLLAIGICYVVCSFFMPYIGDDIAHSFRLINQNDCWYAIPRSFYRQWLFSNGRMADMILPLALNYPPLCLLALINGSLTVWYFYLVLRWSLGEKRSDFGAVLIIFLLIFTMRWDGLWMEFNTQCNYVWASAFALAGLLTVFRQRQMKYVILSVPFCFFGGAMHEACGFPLACGLICYAMTGGMKSFRPVQKINALAMIVGSIVTITSPGVYERVGAMLQPEPIAEILIWSDCYVLVLIAASAYLLIRKRKLLFGLCRTPWIVFVVASVVSSCFMLLSRYGGRTGWFAQTFALIALAMMLRKEGLFSISSRVKTVAAAMMSLAVCFECVALAFWQVRVGSQTREVLDRFVQSEDGVVFFNWTQDCDIPFYVRGRVHGVPDADDDHYRAMISKHIGNGKPLIILPEMDSVPDVKQGMVRLSDGSYLSGVRLPGIYTECIVPVYPKNMVLIEDNEYIEKEFVYQQKRYYQYSLVDEDRGQK